jgi:glycosyltransferase involved in cell wall biosynthesis
VIRCAFVSHHTGYGGAELMLLTLLGRLDRSRVAPVLLAPGEGMLTEGARALGAEVRVVPVAPALLGVSRGGADSRRDALRAAAALPAAAARLARAIRACRADVVVTNSAKAHVYGSLAARLARRPLVWRMHDTIDSADFAGSTRRLLLAIGRRAPVLVLAVSDSTGRALVEGGVPAERVATLYNGIDLAGLRDGAARAPARVNGAPRVGSVGRLTPLKGHAVVLDAAAALLERGVDADFVIAGAAAREAPSHLQELRARAERLGIADRVELVSPFPDLARVLSGLDVMVHASVLPDSLPTTVLEAMALGVPVVATDLGGVPELVRDAETGIVVPPNDPERIADAVAALIAAPETRAAVGRAAYEEATARFDVAEFADAFASHLERVMRRAQT